MKMYNEVTFQNALLFKGYTPIPYPCRLTYGNICTPCLFDYFLAIYLTHSKRRDLAQNLRGGMNFELKWRQLLQSKLVNIAKNCLLQKIVPFLRGKLVGAPLKMMTTCHDVTQHTNLWRRAGLMLHISLAERINSQKILHLWDWCLRILITNNGALKKYYYGSLKNENTKFIFLHSEIVTLN